MLEYETELEEYGSLHFIFNTISLDLMGTNISVHLKLQSLFLTTIQYIT